MRSTWIRKNLISVGFGLAASTWAVSAAGAAPDAPPAMAEQELREPAFGLGYHPGNFIGPLAFDVVVEPMSHVAFDLQVGYWRRDNGVRGLGLGPQVQWKFRRGWQTPYVGLVYRHEEVWADGVTASSKGGAVTAGWQFRWSSGFGVLLGAGILYQSAVTLEAPRAGYFSSGGTYGTYEIGVRYFL